MSQLDSIDSYLDEGFVLRPGVPCPDIYVQKKYATTNDDGNAEKGTSSLFLKRQSKTSDSCQESRRAGKLIEISTRRDDESGVMKTVTSTTDGLSLSHPDMLLFLHLYSENQHLRHWYETKLGQAYLKQRGLQ